MRLLPLFLLACTGATPDLGDECTTEQVYAEPGCGDGGGNPITAGCYTACTGENDTCATGTCTEAWTNPCICAEGEACCDACGGGQWLCL